MFGAKTSTDPPKEREVAERVTIVCSDIQEWHCGIGVLDRLCVTQIIIAVYCLVSVEERPNLNSGCSGSEYVVGSNPNVAAKESSGEIEQ